MSTIVNENRQNGVSTGNPKDDLFQALMAKHRVKRSFKGKSVNFKSEFKLNKKRKDKVYREVSAQVEHVLSEQARLEK